MTQPPPSPLPPPPAAPGVHVRCAGCRMILTVAAGVTEFACPSCKLPQMLPPELMAMRNPPQQQQLKPAHGIDPTKIQLPCAHCKAILNVPHGLARFKCPQCETDLAVDLSKLKNLMPPPPPPPEEVNEVPSSLPGDSLSPIIYARAFSEQVYLSIFPLSLSLSLKHPLGTLAALMECNRKQKGFNF